MSTKTRSLVGLALSLPYLIYAIISGEYLFISGAFLLIVGSVSNWIAILANNGIMPMLMTSGVSQLLQHGKSEDEGHCLYYSSSEVRFAILCDRFNFVKIIDGDKWKVQSYSIGDFLLYSGATLATLGMVISL